MFDFFNDLQLLKDLLTGTVGAFLGFLGAYIIFKKGVKNDKEKEAEKQRNEQFDKLKYFTALTSNTIKIGGAQAKNFKIYSDKLNTEPLERHLLENIANQDVKRATEKINIEEFYLSYISHFGSQDDIVSEFTKIVSAFDYIDALNKDAIRIVKDKLEFIYSKKVHYKEVFEKTLNDVGNLAFKSELFADNNLHDFINKIMNDFYKNRQVIEDYDNPKIRFIEPLSDFLIKNSYLVNPTLNQIFFALKECLITYSSIIIHVNDLSLSINSLSKQMDEATNMLIKASTRLITGIHKSS